MSADFWRGASNTSSKESVTWQTCLEGGSFSRSVTEFEDVAEAGKQGARDVTKATERLEMGFDFDTLPDMSADFWRGASNTSSKESVTWQTCLEGGSFSRSVTEFEDAAEASPAEDSAEESPRSRSEEHRTHSKERLQTCADGFGFDFDDLPPIPGTTATPTELRSSGSRCFPSKEEEEEELRPLQPLPVQRRAIQGSPRMPTAGCRLAVVLNGSQGDIQPLASLAIQLQLFRHKVKVFTTVNLVGWCKDHGLDAVPVFADSQAVMQRMGGMVKDMSEGMIGCGRIAQAWVSEHKCDCLDVEDALDRFQPTVIVCGIQALGVAFRYETRTGVPVIPVYLSYDAYSAFGDYAHISPARPVIMAVSTFLEHRRPERPPSSLHFTHEFVLYEVPQEEDLEDSGNMAELRRFLGSGKPPVAVGWGSMIAAGLKPVEMLALALRALRTVGERAVIIGGWAGLDQLAADLRAGRLAEELGPDADKLAEFATRDVCFVDSAPHEWLFPQCCTVVHHGGAGTWQAVVRSGKPSVVTPIFADQFSHAANVERMGLGVGFKKQLQQIEAEELASAITLSQSQAKTAAAEAAGQKMRVKVGERDAAAIIDAYARTKMASRHQQTELPQACRNSEASRGRTGRRAATMNW